MVVRFPSGGSKTSLTSISLTFSDLGGHHACPGRVLAKRIMIISCALITTMFDIEILAGENNLEYGSPRFGFGVRKPKGQVPFLIRRRTGV